MDAIKWLKTRNGLQALELLHKAAITQFYLTVINRLLAKDLDCLEKLKKDEKLKKTSPEIVLPIRKRVNIPLILSHYILTQIQ